jgi:hypothetical protein
MVPGDHHGGSAAYAGTELIRRRWEWRSQGRHHHPDADKRAYAERVNILCAKDYIMHRDAFQTGEAYVQAVRKASEAAK